MRKTNADDATTGTALTNATGLDFNLAANTTYTFDYEILFQTAATTTGISLAVYGPGTPDAHELYGRDSQLADRGRRRRPRAPASTPIGARQ